MVRQSWVLPEAGDPQNSMSWPGCMPSPWKNALSNAGQPVERGRDVVWRRVSVEMIGGA
jgi:hypothetical protein